MNTKKIGTLLTTLSVALIGVAAALGTAAAQDAETIPDELTSGANFNNQNDNSRSDFQDYFDDIQSGDDLIAICQQSGGQREGVAVVADLSQDSVRERTSSQDVSIDEDEALLGIALHNNGADNVNFNNLRDMSATETALVSESQTSNLDREDVFSALALGLDANEGSLEALACVADLDRTVEVTRTMDQTVDLDEDTVLLAIALGNAADSPLELEEIASFDIAETTTRTADQTVDVDREDTFLALALGAGGSG